MILYHGSNIEIDQIDLGKSRPNKDFGQGFYLSADRNQALEMAKNRVRLMHTGIPVINAFEFDESALNNPSLNVKIWDDYCAEWAQFVVDNRNPSTPNFAHDYDIVYGPIADDGVTFQLRRYEAKIITIEQLVTELRYSKGITFQYFFATPLSLSYLTKIIP